MTPDINTTNTPSGGWLTAILVSFAGVGAVLAAVRKWRVGWSADSVHLDLLAAQRAQVAQLHEELARMGAQNGKLADELNRLQLTIVELHKEVANITQEREELRAQLAALTRQISRITPGGGEPGAPELADATKAPT